MCHEQSVKSAPDEETLSSSGRPFSAIMPRAVVKQTLFLTHGEFDMMLVEDLYQEQIRPLPVADRLQLIARIAEDLASGAPSTKRRITELCGLGKEIWQDVDAQQYIDNLRSEWKQRS